MAQMFTKGFKPKSTTKKAKAIIRKEMLSYFPAREYCTKTNLDAMKSDAEAASVHSKFSNDYVKGERLVDAWCLACSYYDQKKMLSKIYGKGNVAKWGCNKTHDTYRHLVGREYAAMLRERGSRK